MNKRRPKNTKQGDERIAGALQAWRAGEGITRREGARRLGIPERTLEGWELAARKPKRVLWRSFQRVLKSFYLDVDITTPLTE